MTISKTFCPAKWDELFINLSANYVYSCCKSVPVQIVKREDIVRALDKQKINLLNGVQDPACEYCWKLENAGHKSIRNGYLENFNISRLDEYHANTVNPTHVQVSLGNECNFQCLYCNPKFSSQWETDVKNKSYPLYSDKNFYAVDDKNENSLDSNLELINGFGDIESLSINGGETLSHKNFLQIIDKFHGKKLIFSTNLSFKTTDRIDSFFKIAGKYEKVIMCISLDSTGKNAEFVRYGLDYEQMLTNIDYVIDNAPDNIEITITPLMTSISILDLENFLNLVEVFHNKRSTLKCKFTYCRDPQILSLSTLPDEARPMILDQLIKAKDKNYLIDVDLVISAVKSTKFNKTLYNLMKQFLIEFSNRKNIEIPLTL